MADKRQQSVFLVPFRIHAFPSVFISPFSRMQRMQEKFPCIVRHSGEPIRNEFDGLESAIPLRFPKDGPAPFIDPDKPDDGFVFVPHSLFLSCLKKEEDRWHRQSSSMEYVG